MLSRSVNFYQNQQLSSALSFFREQHIQIQPASEHGQAAVGRTRPLFGRAVPIKFHAVIVRVAEVKRLADTVVGCAFQFNARSEDAAQRIRQQGAGGI